MLYNYLIGGLFLIPVPPLCLCLFVCLSFVTFDLSVSLFDICPFVWLSVCVSSSFCLSLAILWTVCSCSSWAVVAYLFKFARSAESADFTSFFSIYNTESLTEIFKSKDMFSIKQRQIDYTRIWYFKTLTCPLYSSVG